MKNLPTFEDYVIQSIITNNEFEITNIRNLESLLSTFFDQDEYKIILEFINRKDRNSIMNFKTNSANDFEFLEIMKFIDQDENQYFVTVYDSKELSQDPQVIDLFRI